MKFNKGKKGFTLVELLVGVGVFSILMIGILTGIVEIYRYNRRAQLENTLNRDAFYVLNTLRQVVANGTVDYEEYNRISKCDDEDMGCLVAFALEYGEYSKSFYDPGVDGVLGALCNTGVPVETDPSCVIDKRTLDKNVGRNPYDLGVAENTITAFCDDAGVNNCNNLEEYYLQDHLFVLSSDGKQKFFIVNEPYSRNVEGVDVDENLVSFITMDGTDTNGDGIMDDWQYSTGFSPDEIDETIMEDEYDGALKGPTYVYNGFIPLHSLKSTVTDLKFYISPLEDPYKAFAEIDSIVQPRVTVFLTMQPSATELTDYMGPIPEISLQATFISQSYDEIKAPLD